VLWTLLAWILVRLIRSGNERLWLLWGMVVGIGLLNKYAIAFFAIGLFAGVLATPLRRSLARPWFWGARGAGNDYRAARISYGSGGMDFPFWS